MVTESFTYLFFIVADPGDSDGGSTPVQDEHEDIEVLFIQQTRIEAKQIVTKNNNIFGDHLSFRNMFQF